MIKIGLNWIITFNYGIHIIAVIFKAAGEFQLR